MPLTATPQESLVHASPEEQDDLMLLSEQLVAFGAAHSEARLIGPDGEQVKIPASAFEALKVVVEGMVRGLTMTLVPHGKELTTQQAAEILHMSRPHLVRLLDAGEIDFHRVGSHRRVRIEDVLDYRVRRASQRRDALAELTRLSEDIPGGYR